MMAKKEMKRLARRSLAMFMTLVMTISMLQLQVFAAESFKDQTMDGWFLLNEDNEVIDTTNDEIHEEHGFQLSKTIEQTGVNAFDITLKVVTSQTVTTSDAALQIVVDMSNSMNYCAECGATNAGNCGCNAGTRIAAVKEAIAGEAGFLDSLVENNDGNIYVSVIWFGTKAGTTIDWTNIADGDGLDDVKEAVNGMSLPGGNDGGTNLEAGLLLARNRLGMDAVANASSKYTVLLTDGQPTYRVTNNSVTSTTSITSNTNDNDGSDASDAEINEAVAAADDVKELSKLYTICYGVANDGLYTSTACEHCDLTQAEHERVRENTWFGSRTRYYCKDANGNRLETTFSAATVTIGQFLADDIATEATEEITYAFNAADTDEVNAAFADIALSSTAGMNGAGTSVTDPMGGAGHYEMGQYIVLNGLTADAEANGATATNSSISWELDPAKADKKTEGDVTTYTYEITYSVTLDTAAKGFEENKYYPTNGYTYLSVPTEEGVEKIYFPVPGVCGEIPETEWTIEYYLQGNAEAGDYEKYTLDKDASASASTKVWTSVSAPEGYASKYENYTFVEGKTTMQVVPNGENVMRLYYDHILVPVTVNHYYKTDIINAKGETVPGTYGDPITTKEDVKVGTEYVAEPQTTLGDIVYDMEKAEPSMKITTAKDGENVINLYYTRLDDQRAVTSAAVKHIYTTYEYVIEDGEYVLKNMGSVTETAEQATDIRATTVFNVSSAPLAGYEKFKLNEDEGDYESMKQSDDSLSFVVVAEPTANIRTLYFDMVTDNRQPIQVTVNHNYTKTVTSIDENGNIDTTTTTGIITETKNAFVGESFEAVQINGYEGDEYVSDSGNGGKLYTEALTGNKTIDLFYTLVETPAKTNITVNHIYRAFTKVTIEETKEVIDPESGEVIGTEVIGTTTETRMDREEKSVEVNDLYVGQKYTAEKIGKDGYTFNEEESDEPTIIVRGDDVIELYYDKWAEDDEREDADIDVIHNYTTYLTSVVGGKVQTQKIPDGSVTEEYTECLAGDKFTAEPLPLYKENEYTRITEIVPVILQPGTNDTIVINYERKVEDLEETTYKVNYEYHTYDMTVVDGVADYYEEPSVAYGDSVTGAGYVGQIVNFGDGKLEGFTAVKTHATTQTLKAEGNENEWTFVYEQYIPLKTGTVTVNHYYKTTTIAIDGTSSVSEYSVLGAPVTKYVGELMQVEAVPNGFELVDIQIAGMEPRALTPVVEITVSGDIVVNFYYEKLDDNSKLVDYTITHIYEQYTWDGELIGEPVVSATKGKGYATTQITASPKTNGYELVESTYNDGEELTAPYTITLQVGDNNIVFVYQQYLAPKKVDVKIIHNYYDTESDVDVNAPLSVYEEVKVGIPEGKCCVATERMVDGYRFFSANPEEMFVIVDDEGNNTIVINYVRAVAEYKVIHIYNRNGSEEGRTTKTLSGLAGDVITADSIERVPTFEGKKYTFQSISGDITLDADEIQTITLVYNRKAGGNIKPEPPKPEPPVIEIPEEDVPLVDIPDEEIPVTDLPEEDIPLADVPKTGETMIYRIMAAISGITLMALAVTGRKKEEEEMA